jgi:hypothetical protein
MKNSKQIFSFEYALSAAIIFGALVFLKSQPGSRPFERLDDFLAALIGIIIFFTLGGFIGPPAARLRGWIKNRLFHQGP